MMMHRFNMIWRRLTIQLTADRRKFGVLCTLTALGLLFWARIIVINNLPRTVLAEDGVEMVSRKRVRELDDVRESGA
jgi:hypothetical protein